MEQFSFRPARRDDSVIIQELDQELLVYDLRDHRAYCLNPPAAAIWRLADGSRTVSQLRGALPAPYKALDDQAVLCGLQHLAAAGLLMEPLPDAPRVSRRDLFRRAGQAGLAAVPLVAMLEVPAAAAHASCRGAGERCNLGSKECCPGFECIGKVCLPL